MPLDLRPYLQTVRSRPFLSLIFSPGKGMKEVSPLRGFHEDRREKAAHSGWTHHRFSVTVILSLLSIIIATKEQLIGHKSSQTV